MRQNFPNQDGTVFAYLEITQNMSTIRLSCDESAIKLSIILSLRMKPNQPYAAITQVFIVNCRRNNNIAKCTNSIICDFTHKPFFCLSPRSVLCYAFERGSADCRSAKTIFHIANICTAFHLDNNRSRNR